MNVEKVSSIKKNTQHKSNKFNTNKSANINK